MLFCIWQTGKSVLCGCFSAPFIDSDSLRTFQIYIYRNPWYYSYELSYCPILTAPLLSLIMCLSSLEVLFMGSRWWREAEKMEKHRTELL